LCSEVATLSPAELSGGMQKRVALARAIAAEPEIVFFDEPTTGLDPIMADVINRLIVTSVRELGATTVSITHDMTSARRIADRIAMLNKGRIVWQGPANEIDHTDNPFVDQFVKGRRGGPAIDFVALRGETAGPPRRQTGIAELDRVCGGGLVPGSTILVGGDPGIGKSTLLLQAAASLATHGGTAAYITGEEAIDQIRLRAERLGVADRPVGLAAASSVRDIVESLDSAEAPNLVVIDSIQTMYLDTLDSAPGTVSQVRGAAQELIGLAKRRGFVVVLVGHV